MAIDPKNRAKPSTPPRPAAKKPLPKPLRFGEPEKTNWLGLILFWVFVIGAIGASIWLLNRSPHLRPLDCDTSSGMGSLTRFGGCHERAE